MARSSGPFVFSEGFQNIFLNGFNAYIPTDTITFETEGMVEVETPMYGHTS